MAHMNDQFTQELLDSLGEDVGSKLASQNLLSKEQTKEALGSLSPVILSSLKRKQEELDEGSFEALLESASASESHLENLDDTLSLETPNPEIGGVLDAQAQDQTVMALSKKLGVGSGIAKKVLPMLIPIILGQLMKKGKQSGGGQSRSSGIGGILDRNGDGTMIDDIAGMILGGGSSSKQGFIRMILSMIFGRK